MKRLGLSFAVLAVLSIFAVATSAQSKSGLDKLYILNCCEGVAGDILRCSPGVDVGKSMPMAENCYLMHHTQGGSCGNRRDAIAAMPGSDRDLIQKMIN